MLMLDQEAKSQEIELHDDDAAAIERLLLFCYIDNYDDAGNVGAAWNDQDLASRK